MQNIFIAIITDGFQSLKIKPISKTGADEEEPGINRQQSVNLSLQNMASPKNEARLLSRKFVIRKKIKVCIQ